jgi:hypothetical protein
MDVWLALPLLILARISDALVDDIILVQIRLHVQYSTTISVFEKVRAVMQHMQVPFPELTSLLQYDI